MFRASISDILDGSPAVSDRFWSKSLKPLVSERNMQIVIDDIIIGIVTSTSWRQALAPSMAAASSTSPGIDCRPAM